MLPVMRDPDGFIYYKEEVGGLVMGGFEPKAKPWKVDPIPATFQFQLLDEDWDQFEPLMTNAIHRTPCLETAQIKMLLNGPESFTPDGNFILGEAPELRNYFVAAGFNSAGIANSGGAGQPDRRVDRRRRGAERPVGRRHPPLRRRSPPTAGRSPSAPARRSACTTRCAGRARSSRPRGRCARSPLYDLLAAKRRRSSAARTAGSARTTSGRAGAPRRRTHDARPARLAAVGDRRAARDARGGRAVRPDLVRQAAAAGPRRAGGAAAPVRQRDRRRRRAAWSTPRCSTSAAASRAT